MTFYRGQKVVCVDIWPNLSLWQRVVDTWYEWRHPYTHPIKGQIYTVTNVYAGPSSGLLHLELAELTDGDPTVWNPGFYATGFRPLVERKTDISVFTAMLDRSRQTERA